MGILSDIGNLINSGATAVGNGLSDIGNFVGGSSANEINGIRPTQDLNLLSKIGLGLQGNQAVQQYQQNYNLQNLGQQLANGNIDQSQYLKSIAQYSPDEYNKMLIAQLQSTPAAVKTFNDIQSLKNQGLEAYRQGDLAKAKDFIDQANLLTGVSRPAYAGANMFSLPGGQPIQQPSPNAVTTGNIAPIPGSNVQQPIVPSNNPTVSPEAVPAKDILNNTSGMTDAEKAVAGITPITSPIPQPPIRQPGQTEAQHKNDLKTWEDANAAYVSEQKASGHDTVKYDEDLTKRAQASSKMIQLITEMRDAQQNFQSGALAPARATVLKWGRALGADLSPDEIASLSNQQAFNKWTNTLIGQAAKAEGGASRLQAAYNGIVGANPNASLEPETLNKLFDAMSTTAAQDINEQNKWAAEKTANPSLTAAQFRRQYTSELNAQQEKAGGNLPGYKGNPTNLPEDLPKGTTANPDGTFTLPNGMKIRKKK